MSQATTIDQIHQQQRSEFLKAQFPDQDVTDEWLDENGYRAELAGLATESGETEFHWNLIHTVTQSAGYKVKSTHSVELSQ